jgi:acetoacetate decarboxylase
MGERTGFVFEANRPYIMPAHFGSPERGWDGQAAHYADNTATTILYVTDARRAAALLPPGFTVADPPVVSVTHVMCRGVAFMAGGGYNLVAVNVAARFEGRRDRAAGNFALVLWENDFMPVLLGREVLGAPKLLAEIPDLWMRDGRRGFAVSERGSLLLEGEVWDLRELAPAERAALAVQTQGQIWMGWKYIPSCNMRGADVSFATALPARSEMTQAWMGQGTVTFHALTWERAPLSAEIVGALAQLPVEQGLGAVVTRGSQDLLIGEQHPLE